MLSPLLSHLRAVTTEQHRALERTPCMERLLSDSVSSADVARVLTVLHRGFAVLEPPLAALGWYRLQQPALRADLCRLSAGIEPRSAAAAASDPSGGTAGLIGTAYVLVGSRLGGKSIGRHLAAHLGADFVARSAFYGEEAAHAGEQWSALVRAAADADPSMADAAGQAAASAFELLRRFALAV